jgi:hypothetical protein
MSKYAPIKPYARGENINGPKKDLTDPNARKPGAVYVASCSDPRFQQSVPNDREWKLIAEGDGDLLYQDDEGTELLVPSMWYNQTTEMHIERWRFYAERSREAAAHKRSHAKFSWDISDAECSEAKAVELDALADKAATEGKPGYYCLDPRP